MSFVVPLLLAVVCFAQTKPATKPTGFARWENDIKKLEAKDNGHPPQHVVLFTGSSTVVKWNTLADDFKGVPVLNRAFGGSQIFEVTHFADRIIFPYNPQMVVLRCGSNDINAKKSPQRVFNDYKDFVAKIRSKFPDVPIVFTSIAPAPVRWSQRFDDRKVNDLIKQYTQETPGLKYVETYDITVTPDDHPREGLFVKDRLHPNAEGYRLLAERIRPVLPTP